MGIVQQPENHRAMLPIKKQIFCCFFVTNVMKVPINLVPEIKYKNMRISVQAGSLHDWSSYAGSTNVETFYFWTRTKYCDRRVDVYVCNTWNSDFWVGVLHLFVPQRKQFAKKWTVSYRDKLSLILKDMPYFTKPPT